MVSKGLVRRFVNPDRMGTCSTHSLPARRDLQQLGKEEMFSEFGPTGFYSPMRDVESSASS